MIIGDINNDGIVDQIDLNILTDHFGEENQQGQPWDLNGDGIIDLQDFSIIKSHWGEGVASDPWAMTAAPYVPYDGPLFVGEPVYSDVRQGLLADCSPLAGLAALAYISPKAIKSAICFVGDKVSVKIYVDGEAKYVIMNKTLPTYGECLPSPVYAKIARDGALWVPFIEKALASLPTPGGGAGSDYRKVTSWHAKDLWVMLISCDIEVLHTQFATDQQIVDFLNATKKKPAIAGTSYTTSVLIKGHSYAILDFDGTTITLYNVWGYDGLSGDGNPSDGIVHIPLLNFKSNIDYLERAIF